MIIIKKNNQYRKKANKNYDSGFIRKQNEISIIVDKDGVNFSSVTKDLIEIILSLDPDNKKFQKIKKEIQKDQKE
jgi:hypothetical protein